MSAVLVEDGPDKGAVWHFGEPVKEQRANWSCCYHLLLVRTANTGYYDLRIKGNGAGRRYTSLTRDDYM